MKKLGLGIIGTVLFASGCTGVSGTSPVTSGKSSGNISGKAPGPVTGQLKVALLTPGPVSDAGWSAMAYDGLKAIESNLGATVNNQEATDAKIKDAFRSYAKDGYNLIIGHGYEYNQVAMEVAPDFPNTVFVSSSGDKTAANVGAFRFYLEQGFFIAGVFAAEMSKTNKVAMIGLDKIPSIASTFKAFEAGVKFAKPGVVVLTGHLDSDTDTAKSKLATQQVISQGSDVIIHQANAAAPGVFAACKEKNVIAIGANADQNNDASGAVLASAVIIAKPAFVELGRIVKEGKFSGMVQLKGMDVGAIDFVMNPKKTTLIPDAVRQKIEALKEEIRSGNRVVPKDDF